MMSVVLKKKLSFFFFLVKAQTVLSNVSQPYNLKTGRCFPLFSSDNVAVLGQCIQPSLIDTKGRQNIKFYKDLLL